MNNYLEQLVADLNVLNNKIRTYHYNVVGPDFYQTHIFLEEQYEKTYKYIDDVAEAVKMEGGYPIGTLAQMLEITKIQEAESKDYTSAEIYKSLLADYEMILNDVLKVDNNDLDTATETLMDDLSDKLSKTIWFLRAFTK